MKPFLAFVDESISERESRKFMEGLNNIAFYIKLLGRKYTV